MKTDNEPDEVFAKSVEFANDFMYVHLTDGRYISVPISSYRRIREATPEQRDQWEITPHGIAIHWEAIDEDLSVSGLLRDFGAQKAIYA